MIKNTLFLLLRSMFRYPSQYFPNLLGLTIAFASVITVYISVQYETSFDQFHANKDRIYRISYDESISGIEGARHLPTVGPQVAKAMMETFPEVEAGTRIRQSKNNVVEYNDTPFFEDNLFYVDPEFLTMFSFPLQAGDIHSALELRNSIIITSEMAQKYFGDQSAMNKDLTLNGEEVFTVTGVLEPISKTNSLPFDFLLPFEAFVVPQGYPVTLESWGWISFYNYILLKPGTDVSVLEAKMPAFCQITFQ